MVRHLTAHNSAEAAFRSHCIKVESSLKDRCKKRDHIAQIQAHVGSGMAHDAVVVVPASFVIPSVTTKDAGTMAGCNMMRTLTNVQQLQSHIAWTEKVRACR